MKRLSLHWRITLLTALLIACACVCMNLLLYRRKLNACAEQINGELKLFNRRESRRNTDV